MNDGDERVFGSTGPSLLLLFPPCFFEFLRWIGGREAFVAAGGVGAGVLAEGAGVDGLAFFGGRAVLEAVYRGSVELIE